VNKNVMLIVVLAALLAVSGGIYAYTYTTGLGVISITEPTGDIATVNASGNQPEWLEVLSIAQDTETLRPNAAGTYTQCDAVGDTANYLCVDEAVSDGDTTYVRTWGGATELDTYNIEDHTTGSGNVTDVYAYTYTRVDSGTHDAEVAIRTNSTDYFGGYTSGVPTTYTYLSANWDNNPFTNNPWTWAEVDALEIGVRHYDLNGGYLWTTQVYADIDYDYLPVTGNAPTGDLFEVYENPDYSGDLSVRVYLTNTGSLQKAYESLELELYLEDSEEAGQSPNYQELTLENGVASFTLKDPASDNHTLSVIGGDYALVSDNMPEWEAGWTITPEFYCEATQR